MGVAVGGAVFVPVCVSINLATMTMIHFNDGQNGHSRVGEHSDYDVTAVLSWLESTTVA